MGIPVAVGVVNGFATQVVQLLGRLGVVQVAQEAQPEPAQQLLRHRLARAVRLDGWASHLTVKALDRTPPGLGRDTAKKALSLYWIQLGLNALWSPLFFGAGNVGLALVNIGALTGTVGYWAATVKDVDETAGLLAIPYVGWLAPTPPTSTPASGGRTTATPMFGKLKKEAKDL